VTPLVIIAAIAAGILLIAMAVVASSRATKAYAERRSAMATAAGLVRVTTPDRGFVDRVLNLYRQHEDDEVTVRDVFKGDRLDHTLYLMDIVARSPHSDSSPVVSSVVAIQSPRLRLPRLSVRPKLNFKGLLGSALSTFANHFIEGRAPRDLKHVDLYAFADIGEKYALFGADHAAVKAMLSDGLGTQLRSTPWLAIETEGDILTVSRLDLDAQRARARLEGTSPRTVIEDAAHLFEACRRP
jgi:hypothetical protein